MYKRAFQVAVFVVANVLLFRLELAGYRTVKADWSVQAPVGASSPAAAAPACAPAPPAGTTSILSPGKIGYEATLGTLTVKNERSDLVVMVLGDSALHDLAQVVVVAPADSASIRVRAAHYGVAILSGRTWCSLSQGFVAGQHLTLPDGVTVKPDGINELSIGAESNADAIAALYRYDPAAPHEALALDLLGTSAGIVSAGAINGQPMTFVIDTGTPAVTLPPNVATQAGMRCARAARYITPAGSVTGCAAVARDLRFGPYRLSDVDVAVVPGTTEPILGMSVLRLFQLVRHGASVRITPLENATDDVDGSRSDIAFAPIVPWLEVPPAQEASAADLAVVRRHAKTMLVGALFTLLLHVAYIIWSLKACLTWLSTLEDESEFAP
ncbi:retropepsin-like aspartic protease family protein [Duganella vulcania]|uniref:Peptidase A2 domain-containing protein n=1 Tax=Duganella vulcania TaxID=2692166 RepID=A0A845GIA2_9BURK|nr:retropepsin-like aspartic protease [Duganella vulcania]MYM92497.1 hypothetical protein [Duganella vulcania]